MTRCVWCHGRITNLSTRPGYPVWATGGGGAMGQGQTCTKAPAPMFNHSNTRRSGL